MDLKTLRDTPVWEWPEGAREMLLGILRDDLADESERLLAAELAGDLVVINDALAESLLAILQNGHEPEKLRAEAATSLGPALEQSYMDGFEDPDDVTITEQVFQRIQETLGSLYKDGGGPKEVRRRVLEASVHAPQDWHQDAVRTAYNSKDKDWRLTAVFCMRFVRGFEDQIIEALDRRNPDIQYQAVWAAGNWEVDAAWPHIAQLVTSEETDKALLLAAIEAAALIRPDEAGEILGDLMGSEDEDVADAVYEAMAMTGETWGEEDDEADPNETLH